MSIPTTIEPPHIFEMPGETEDDFVKLVFKSETEVFLVMDGRAQTVTNVSVIGDIEDPEVGFLVTTKNGWLVY